MNHNTNKEIVTDEKKLLHDFMQRLFLLYRKDRLWRSLKLKIARTEAGINIGRHCLEDIKTFYSSLVGK